MVRGTLSAVFILLLAVNGDATERRLPDFFNQAVKPCDDIHGHVCVNDQEMEEPQTIKTSGLLHGIVKVLNGTRPRGFERILNAVVKEAKRDKAAKEKCSLEGLDIKEAYFGKWGKEFDIGRIYGRMIAFGRFGPESTTVKQVKIYRTMNETHTVYHFEITIPDAGSRTAPNFETFEHSSFDKVDKFVKGIFDGYFAEVPEMRFGENPENVSYRYMDKNNLIGFFRKTILGTDLGWKDNSESLENIMKNISKTGFLDEVERYELIMDKRFAGYGNVLIAYLMYTHEAQLNPGVANDFDRLKQRILDEIRGFVTKATWMSDTARNKILDYFNQNEIIIGIDKKHRNVTLLKEMLNVYEEHFAKVDPGAECEYELLLRAHGLARHKLIYSNKGTLVPSLAHLQYERSIIDNSAHYIETGIHVLPGFLHILNNYKLSTGFKYGYVGWAVAHEIFHGLGISYRRTAKLPHLQGAVDTTHFRNELDCYLDFYDEDQFCIEEKGKIIDCPNIYSKVDELFSDVEATRIVFPLLLEALDGRPARNRRDAKDSEKLPLFDWRPPGVPEEEVLMSAAGYSEQQWFFLAQQFFACTSSDEMYQLRSDPHPRADVRISAIARQIAAFTKTFGCNPGQGNYVRRKQCAVYTPKDSWPEDDERDAARQLTVDVKTRSSSKASWNALFVLAFMFLPFACIM